MAEEIRGSYKDIADAIRAKKGSSNEMTPAQMPAEIESIPSGSSYGNGIWWISENYQSVDLTESPGIYDIQSEVGSNPPEQLYLDTGYWYQYTGSSLDTSNYMSFSTNYAYAYKDEGGGSFSYGLSLNDVHSNGELIYAASAGCSALTIEVLKDAESEYDEIRLHDLSVGESVTFRLNWGSEQSDGGTFTITRTE